MSGYIDIALTEEEEEDIDSHFNGREIEYPLRDGLGNQCRMGMFGGLYLA